MSAAAAAVSAAPSASAAAPFGAGLRDFNALVFLHGGFDFGRQEVGARREVVRQPAGQCAGLARQGCCNGRSAGGPKKAG